MRFRRLLTCLIACALVLATTPSANAGGLYFVTASEGPLEASATRLSGVSAESWVMFDPHAVYSLHLNSVYIWLDDNDYIEAGWVWYAGDGPEAFVAFEREGHTREQERIWLGHVPAGQWLQLGIANTNPGEAGPTRWECRVGDRRAMVVQDFDRGTLRVSSERQTYRDSNYGIFRDLRRMGPDGDWAAWRDLRVQNGDQDYDGRRTEAGGFEVR